VVGKWSAPCRCPILAADDTDQTQPMVALLIDGLRYGTTGPHNEFEHRRRRPETNYVSVLRCCGRPWWTPRGREGLDVTGH
jgi:hypothetical protein